MASKKIIAVLCAAFLVVPILCFSAFAENYQISTDISGATISPTYIASGGDYLGVISGTHPNNIYVTGDCDTVDFNSLGGNISIHDVYSPCVVHNLQNNYLVMSVFGVGLYNSVKSSGGMTLLYQNYYSENGRTLLVFSGLNANGQSITVRFKSMSSDYSAPMKPIGSVTDISAAAYGHGDMSYNIVVEGGIVYCDVTYTARSEYIPDSVQYLLDEVVNEGTYQLREYMYGVENYYSKYFGTTISTVSYLRHDLTVSAVSEVFEIIYTSVDNTAVTVTHNLSTGQYYTYQSGNKTYFGIYLNDTTLPTNIILYAKSAYGVLIYNEANDEGYNQGISANQSANWQDGYDSGHQAGYTEAYNKYHELQDTSVVSIFYAIADTPVKLLSSMMNVEVFGTNIFLVFQFLVVCAIGIFIWRFYRRG